MAKAATRTRVMALPATIVPDPSSPERRDGRNGFGRPASRCEVVQSELHDDLLCKHNRSSIIPAMVNRIALLRADRGVSRRELAEAVGVNPQTIGYLERGDYKPSLELALKIARHFGVAVEMLFSLDRFPMTFGRAGEGE